MNLMMNHFNPSTDKKSKSQEENLQLPAYVDEVAVGSFALYILNNRDRMIPGALLEYEN